MKIKILVGLIIGVVFVGGIFFWKRSKQNVLMSSQTSSVQENQEKVPQVAVSSTKQEPQLGEFIHDQDSDGLSDEKEKELGLSDTNSDFDLDGLDDNTEINLYKTDPKNKDTDGDGYVDGYEVLNGFNPNGSGKLKP